MWLTDNYTSESDDCHGKRKPDIKVDSVHEKKRAKSNNSIKIEQTLRSSGGDLDGIDSSSDEGCEPEDDYAVNGLKWRAAKTIIQILLEIDGEEDDIQDWLRDVREVNLSSQDAVFKKTTTLYRSQLVILLRECLLSSRWADALCVLTNILKDPRSCYDHNSVWRVACQLLFMDEKNIRMLDQFINQAKQLATLHTKHMLLEYVLNLLTHNRLEDAEQCLHSSQGNRLAPKKRIWLKDSKYIDKLMAGYEGLLHYSHWLQKRLELEECTKLPFGSSSQMNCERSMQLLSDKANQCFVKICSQKEIVVDIFISKHVHLLEYYEKFDEAKDVLLTYWKNNSTNPNAHKYYYKFLKEHQESDEDKVNMIKCLRELCDNVPSDPLALELHELLIQDGCHIDDTLYILFDYIDYNCRKNDKMAWKYLSQQLMSVYLKNDQDDSANLKTETMLSDEDNVDSCSKIAASHHKWNSTDLQAERAAVNKCWMIRQSWWPAYHWINTDQDDLDLLENKAIVASFLMGRDNEFIKNVASRSNSASLVRVLKHTE